MPSRVAQAECEAGCRINYDVFEAVGRAGIGPQGGRN